MLTLIILLDDTNILVDPSEDAANYNNSNLSKLMFPFKLSLNEVKGKIDPTRVMERTIAVSPLWNTEEGEPCIYVPLSAVKFIRTFTHENIESSVRKTIEKAKAEIAARPPEPESEQEVETLENKELSLENV